ncbi:hypothetical protein ACQP3C_29225, partial [Escherichia coli]
ERKVGKLGGRQGREGREGGNPYPEQSNLYEKTVKLIIAQVSISQEDFVFVNLHSGTLLM